MSVTSPSTLLVETCCSSIHIILLRLRVFVVSRALRAHLSPDWEDVPIGLAPELLCQRASCTRACVLGGEDPDHLHLPKRCQFHPRPSPHWLPTRVLRVMLRSVSSQHGLGCAHRSGESSQALCPCGRCGLCGECGKTLKPSV